MPIAVPDCLVSGAPPLQASPAWLFFFVPVHCKQTLLRYNGRVYGLLSAARPLWMKQSRKP
jgi:hypothetical protein